MKRLVILVLMLVVPAVAADSPLVSVVGPTEFAIPARDPGQVVEVLPPISLLIEADLKPEAGNATSMTTRVQSVSVGTTAYPEYGKAFEFGSFAAGKKGELRELSVKVHLGEIPDPQTYVVKILLLRDGDPTVPTQTIDLKFTRAPATLSVSQLRLQNVRLFPLLNVDSFSPNQLKLQETSGRVGVTGIQMQVKDFLTGPDGFPVAAQLQVPSIKEIDAGQDSTVELKIAGDVPLGSTKGTLVIRSRQLSQPVETTIEIVTHLCRFWLLLALSVSILLGYWFRTKLDERRLENLGRLAAEQQYQQIEEWKDKAVDQDLAQKLGDILGDLRRAIEATPFNATTLDTATKKAVSDAETKLKEADTQRETLRGRIKTLREKLGSPLGQPKSISNAIETLISRLQEQERELNRGAVGSVERELNNMDAEVQVELPILIAQWAQEIHNATNKMSQWTGLEFEEARKKINEQTNQANAANLELDESRQLARETQISLVSAGLRQVIDLSTQIVQRMKVLNLRDLAPQLGSCDTGIEAAKKLQGMGIEQIAAVAQAIADLHECLRNTIEKAVSLKNVAKPTGLEGGDFAKATAKFLDSLPKEKPFGPGGTEEVGTRFAVASFSSLIASMVPQSGTAWWEVQVKVPISPLAGEEVTANAVSVGTREGDALSFEWQIGTEAPHLGASSHRFVPRQAGVLTVSVRAIDSGSGESRTAAVNIQVRPRHGSESVAVISESLNRDEGLQTFVSGVFIAMAGYAIFQANWYGTFLDFLAAALWGFSIDFSVAKVREMAGPLLGRAVPFEGSK